MKALPPRPSSSAGWSLVAIVLKMQIRKEGPYLGEKLLQGSL